MKFKKKNYKIYSDELRKELKQKYFFKIQIVFIQKIINYSFINLGRN